MYVNVNQADKLLRAGNLVCIATETVYGIAAWAEDAAAVERLFAIKKRPRNNPLIVHLASKEAVMQYVETTPPHFEALADVFWPGPLTMVLPAKCDMIPSIVRAGKKTCAFRVPNHVQTRALLAKISPIVAPSANLSGKPSSTKKGHIECDFGKTFPVLEGEPSQHGVESTIIMYQNSNWIVLRRGAISREDLAAVLGYMPACADSANDDPLCPGQLFKHYAPKATLTLSTKLDTADTVLGFSDRVYPKALRCLYLGASDDAQQVCRNLYDMLRLLDSEGIEKATVDMNFGDDGLWHTIRERLERAACN